MRQVCGLFQLMKIRMNLNQSCFHQQRSNRDICREFLESGSMNATVRRKKLIPLCLRRDDSGEDHNGNYVNDLTICLILRAYPNNPLASTGCVGLDRRQAASSMLYIACFAFLAHNRLARSRADERLLG
jgi:hypothetical protein